MNNRIIVVTGATSMIGTAIIRAYLNNTVETIYAVVRPNSKNLYRLPNDPRIKVIECAAEEYGNLKNIIQEKCDTFFHIAWDGTGATRSKSTYGQAQNILYTLTALKLQKNWVVKNTLALDHKPNMDALMFQKSMRIHRQNPSFPMALQNWQRGNWR